MEQRLLQLIILGTLNNDTSTNEVDKDEEMSKNYSGIQEETIWGNTGNIQVENSKANAQDISYVQDDTRHKETNEQQQENISPSLRSVNTALHDQIIHTPPQQMDPNSDIGAWNLQKTLC